MRSQPVSGMRFARLSDEVSHLLAELYHLEADPSDLAHAKRIAASATPSTIGTVIHHLHILINEAKTRRAQDEIDLYLDNGIEFP